MTRLFPLILVIWSAMLLAGCSKEETPSSNVKPREAPTLTPSTGANSDLPSKESRSEPTVNLPAGHPPIGSAGLPAGHPPIGGGTTAPAASADMGIELHMPKEFMVKPARTMTLLVYAAPKVEGDSEDADVAVSALGSKVPLKMNVDRWCGQFDLPAGQTCETGVKQEKLEGTKYATTLVEIAGTYKGSSMMGPQGSPKASYKMVAAEIVTPDRSFYVKMTGPEKTVEHWRPELVDTIKAAK